MDEQWKQKKPFFEQEHVDTINQTVQTSKECVLASSKCSAAAELELLLEQRPPYQQTGVSDPFFKQYIY